MIEYNQKKLSAEFKAKSIFILTKILNYQIVEIEGVLYKCSSVREPSQNVCPSLQLNEAAPINNILLSEEFKMILDNSFSLPVNSLLQSKIQSSHSYDMKFSSHHQYVIFS
jgi:hypothetical protein